MNTSSSLARLLLMNAALTAMALSPALAAGEDSGMALSEGGYIGLLNKQTKVHMLVRAIPGRKASFMAAILKPRGEDQEVCTYLVDPSGTEGSYAMSPLMVTPDGEIGMNTAVPSLELMMIQAQAQGSEPKFQIVNASKENTYCFQGSIEFNSGSRSSRKLQSDYEWKRQIEPGSWKVRTQGNIAVFSKPTYANSDSSYTSQVVISSPKGGEASKIEEGKYLAREKAPGFLSLKRSELGAGLQRKEAKHPSRIGLSTESSRGTELYLVNPADSKDVLILKATGK